MRERNLFTIPAGTTFTISTGEYSDHTIHIIAVAEKDIPVKELKDKWVADHPEQTANFKFEQADFFKMLVDENYFKEIPDVWDFHLENYSKIHEMVVYKDHYSNSVFV